MLLFTFGACCMKWNDFCLCLIVEVSIPQAFAVYIPMKQYYQMEVAYSVFRRFFVYDWFSRFWPLKTLITPFTMASSLISWLITYMAVEHTNNTRIQWQHKYDCTKRQCSLMIISLKVTPLLEPPPLDYQSVCAKAWLDHGQQEFCWMSLQLTGNNRVNFLQRVQSRRTHTHTNTDIYIYIYCWWGCHHTVCVVDCLRWESVLSTLNVWGPVLIRFNIANIMVADALAP